MGLICNLNEDNMEKFRKILCNITITIVLISLGIANALFINHIGFTCCIVFCLVLCFFGIICLEASLNYREKHGYL